MINKLNYFMDNVIARVDPKGSFELNYHPHKSLSCTARDYWINLQHHGTGMEVWQSEDDMELAMRTNSIVELTISDNSVSSLLFLASDLDTLIAYVNVVCDFK